MRYSESIAVYVVGVVAFMIFAAVETSRTSFLVALAVLAILHVIVGYTTGTMSALGLVAFLPVLAGFVPTPAGGEVPFFVAALVWGVPCAAILMTAGVGTRALVRWWQHRILSGTCEQ